MVNFHDPSVIINEAKVVDRFWSFVGGIFIWEFLITLDYEWSVVRGHRPYRWTIWVYSLTRIATLATVVLNTYSVNLNTATTIKCHVTTDLQFIFAYLAFTASSLLMVLRIIAIWNRKKIIVAFATGVWGTNIAFLIQGVVRFRASWGVIDVLEGCVFYLDSIRLSTIVAFAADTTLLLIMLLGLYRLRRSGGGLMALGRLLWNQGVVWFLLAVVTELTPTVFIILNLNKELSLLFQVPWVITMSIAATRMYRSLSDFLSPDVSQEIPLRSGRNASESSGTSTAPIILTGIHVAVHTTHEQLHTLQANRFGSSTGGQPPHERPHELIVGVVEDYDIEGKVEK